MRARNYAPPPRTLCTSRLVQAPTQVGTNLRRRTAAGHDNKRSHYERPARRTNCDVKRAQVLRASIRHDAVVHVADNKNRILPQWTTQRKLWHVQQPSARNLSSAQDCR